MTLREKIKKANTQNLIKLVKIIKNKKQLGAWDDKKLTLAAEEINNRNEQQKTINPHH